MQKMTKDGEANKESKVARVSMTHRNRIVPDQLTFKGRMIEAQRIKGENGK